MSKLSKDSYLATVNRGAPKGKIFKHHAGIEGLNYITKDISRRQMKNMLKARKCTEEEIEFVLNALGYQATTIRKSEVA